MPLAVPRMVRSCSTSSRIASSPTTPSLLLLPSSSSGPSTDSSSIRMSPSSSPAYAPLGVPAHFPASSLPTRWRFPNVLGAARPNSCASGGSMRTGSSRHWPTAHDGPGSNSGNHRSSATPHEAMSRPIHSRPRRTVPSASHADDAWGALRAILRWKPRPSPTAGQNPGPSASCRPFPPLSPAPDNTSNRPCLRPPHPPADQAEVVFL
jgi:hypothetical protein